MSSQLERWRGEFGEAYTDRNPVDWLDRAGWWARLLAPKPRPKSVLEVGCNRGHNLIAISRLLPSAKVWGVEPNEHARSVALESRLDVAAGDIYEIPFERERFDLAFTCGVLIHVPPDDLDQALREMHRVARRWLLAIEYAGDDETVEYRGHQDMLWKRDYGQHYLRLFPEMHLLDQGDLTEAEGFARARFWMLEKPT